MNIHCRLAAKSVSAARGIALGAVMILLFGACHAGPAAGVLDKSALLLFLISGVSETLNPVQPALVEAAPETPIIVETVDEAPETIAGVDSLLPADVALLLPNADPSMGEQLSTANACFVCHPLDDVPAPTGSSWHNIGALAATRVEGQSAEEYLYVSIVDPNIHIIEGSLPNMMPATYKDILTPAQFADLIAYLLTIKAE